MRRSETFLFSALQTLMVVVIGIGALLVPMTLIWLIENDPTQPWVEVFRSAINIWFVAHGVTILVPEGRILGIDVPAFEIALLPIGFSLLIGFLLWRIGRKLATVDVAWPGWAAVAVSYGAVSLGMTAAASGERAYAVDWQAATFPVGFALLAVCAATIWSKPFELMQPGAVEAIERAEVRAWLAARFANWPWALRALWHPAVRAGSAVVAILLAVSAIGLAVLFALNWIQMISLYEALRVTAIGGIVVTIGQVAVLPNLVIYGATWMIGTGFSIGSGSLVSPLGTATGPMPALPILGSLPVGELNFGMIVIVVPMVAALIATLAVRRLADDIRFEFASAWSAAISLGVSIAAVSAAEIFALISLANAKLGPGRLQEVGANPWFAALVLFAEVAVVATLAAFYSARPEAPDHELVKRLGRNQKAQRGASEPQNGPFYEG